MTLSKDVASILDDSSIKGFRWLINSVRLSATVTKELDTPSNIPPIKPPTNLPIALPSCSSILPPSPTNQLNPGSCANAPIAATTNISSAINAAKPNKPIIACGINADTAASAAIRAVTNAAPAIAFIRPDVSSFITASAIAP